MIDLTHAAWRKSSRSTDNGSCAEVADNLPRVIAVGDSKDPAGPALIFASAEWKAFIGGAKDGEFDL
jgi:hypothetical protein